MTGKRRLAVVAITAAFGFGGSALAPGASLGAAPVQVRIDVQATDGVGRIDPPGRRCADGGDGAAWHFEYGGELASGAFSSLVTRARVHVDLHSDTQRHQNVSGLYAAGTNPAGFLQGNQSDVVLGNERGTATLRMTSGSCSAPSLQFDGSAFSGKGEWIVDQGTGAYRSVTGSGTFEVSGGVNPGADNPLGLILKGEFTVLQPALLVEKVGAFWGGLGTDYLTRRPTVVYRITNTGAGDAFKARLTAVSSPTNGVTVLGPTSIGLLDMAAGESRLVNVRYELGLLQPCALVILNCAFQTVLTVNLPDALDVAHVASRTVQVKTPALPPA
jgi:hypothetical protein